MSLGLAASGCTSEEPDGYAFEPAGTGSHRTTNVAQGFIAAFDATGLRVQPLRDPDAAARTWTWSLSTTRIGCRDAMRPIEGAILDATPDGATFQRGLGLAEWYRNDERGLEHGYDVAGRPCAGEGAVAVEMMFGGDLRPTLTGNGVIELADAKGYPLLAYGNLSVFDATGRGLPAHFEVADRRVSIVVDDAGAVYPIVIDPLVWSQQAYVKASLPGNGDGFGFSIGVSGDTAVVGALFEDSNANAINGNEVNSSAPFAGAAYVYTRVAGVWSQQAYIKAHNSDPGDYFGFSVDISGETMVVGARGEASPSNVVNGFDGNNAITAGNSGAAYVFVRAAGLWAEQAYLKASNSDLMDQFGTSVAIDGDTIVVGAPFEDSVAQGVNGPQGTNTNPNSGAAYVFVRQGATWHQEAYLKAHNSDETDRFGWSVAISGGTIVVGAIGEDSGNQQFDGAPDSGAAYVFVRTGAEGAPWVQQKFLKAPNHGENDAFGTSVAIDGDDIVVGAPLEDSNAVGIGGNGANNAASNAGAAYLFHRTGSDWSQAAYLKAANTAAGQNFGASVAITGTTIAVGANLESNGAQGIDPPSPGPSMSESGAVYVFRNVKGTWTPYSYIKASNTGNGDNFGTGLGLGGTLLAVGADQEDSDAPGINGNQNNNAAANAGAAYFYTLFDTCGDGTVTSDELCDTGIAAGQPGACPTSCDDGDPCTADTLLDGGTCQAACTHVPITDTLPPELSGVPANATVECDSVPPPAEVTAVDNCDGVVVVTFEETRTDGECANDYTLTRTWSASDESDNTATATQVVTVQDTTPPVIEASATCLWPPNHKLVPVTFTPVDNCDPTFAMNVVVGMVTTDEDPVRELGAGGPIHCPDAGAITSDPGGALVELRAERSGGGDGRVYQVQVATADSCGNAVNETAAVVVPHDSDDDCAAVDSGDLDPLQCDDP